MFLKITKLIIILLTSNMAFANICKPVSEYRNIKSSVYKHAKPMQRVAASNHLSQIRKELAQEIYRGYISGVLTKSFFKICLQEKEDAKLLDSISAAFKNNLLADFSSSSVKTLKKLGREYSNSPDLFVFQAKLDWPYKSESVAGYYRLSGAMYYMLPEIPYSDFKIVALHELLHKFDEKELYHSSSEYAGKNTMEYAWDLSQKFKVYSQLNKPDQKFISMHVLNGLKRGFLAEFKAWAVTYDVYKKMRRAGEIGAIAWIDDILAQQGQQNYLDFIFNYYQQRFKRPERKSLFAFDLLQDSYDVVIKDLESKDKCGLMDDLAEFIGSCR